MIGGGRGWGATELAARLDTSPRTLRRDIDRLRTLGYPVGSARGPDGCYQLVAGQAMPPLLLSDDEAVATVVGLRFAALTQIDGNTDAIDGALRKLEQVLPPRLRHRMSAVLASTAALSRAGQSLDLRTLRLLATAAYGCQDVRFDYTDRAGRQTPRRVEPYRQVLLGRRWYLLGWDRDRGDWRTYRIDRIREVAVPGTTFSPRDLPADDPVSFVQDSARFPITRHRGIVRFHAPFSAVADRLMTESGSLEAIDDTSCRYITAADSWEWLSITLAMVGVPYTVEGPPELVAHTRELADRIDHAARCSE